MTENGEKEGADTTPRKAERSEGAHGNKTQGAARTRQGAEGPPWYSSGENSVLPLQGTGLDAWSGN